MTSTNNCIINNNQESIISDHQPSNNNNNSRRFTRKQLLSRSINRKEKYCNQNGVSLASPDSIQEVKTHQNIRGELYNQQDSSCNPPAPQQPPLEQRVTKVYIDVESPRRSNDETQLQKTYEEKISSEQDIKVVHFSSDLDEISRGIQVSPPQFRLRFVPHLKWTCSIRGLSLIILQVLASQLGLAIFLIVWTLLWAAAFNLTEGAREASLARELQQLEGRLAMDLASELSQTSSEHRTAWWRILERGIRLQQQALVEALSAGYAHDGGVIWNYAGSLLFAVNMLTTIGFGAPVPRTPLGRTSACIYSAVSIPLHLILVINFGALVADKLELCLRRARKANKSSDFLIPTWFSWLPILAIISYYLFGIALFGGAPLFPLDFTTAGGVGQRSSMLRTVYAIYLEFAVVLAGISVNVWRNTTSSGFIQLGLRLDLLARGRNYS